MGDVVNFREESLLRLDDEIAYRMEEVELTLLDEYFDKFLEYIDKLMKKEDLIYELNENTVVFYIDAHIDEYFQNHPKDIKYIINRIHKLVKEITELLKRRLLIKVMNGEAVEWVGCKKNVSNKGVIFLTLDEYDQMTFYKFKDIFERYENLPIKYKLHESDYGTFLSVRRKLEKAMSKFPDLPIEAMLKKVPKLPSKQNK